MCCKNVVRGDCAASTYLQPLSCNEPTLFDLATDAEVSYKADMLAEAFNTAPTGQFEELETALGMTHNAHGLLAARQLRPYVPPISVLTYDSMHILVSGGLAQNEVGLLMDDLEWHGHGWLQVNKFMTEDLGWRWCGGHGISRGQLRGLFSEAKRKASKHSSFKCQASEIVLLLPILSHFLWSISAALTEELRRKADSLAKLCEVVGLCKQAKAGRGFSAQLACAIKAHAEAFANAYPVVEVKTTTIGLFIYPHKSRATPCWSIALLASGKTGRYKAQLTDCCGPVCSRRVCLCLPWHRNCRPCRRLTICAMR